jgi:hypothetical protein
LGVDAARNIKMQSKNKNKGLVGVAAAAVLAQYAAKECNTEHCIVGSWQR